MTPFSFDPFPVITTERLLLRQMELKDDHEIFALRSDVQNRQYIDAALSRNLHDARMFINEINSGIAKNHWIYWGIALAGDKPLIGTICLWNFSNDSHIADVGYELNADYQGQGYMTEALYAVINYAFKTIRLKKIKAFTNMHNTSSRKLLEKCQFKYKEDVTEFHSKTRQPITLAVYELVIPASKPGEVQY